MSEDNKALYLRMTEAVWNKGDPDAIDEFYAPDVAIHSAAPDWATGRNGVVATVSMIRRGISDLEVTGDFMIAEGDMLAVPWTIRGTHSGELMGVPATRKAIEFNGISVVRFEGGKIVEIWGASDQLGLMAQLGAISS
jgi:steroid delta-isomerase-like uncharacterized protein